jgi:hypothetical protein
MIDDAKDVLLTVNVALPIKYIFIRLTRFLEAFLLDHRMPPTLQRRITGKLKNFGIGN